MEIQHILTTIQHINWHKLIHDYHARHYMWEVSKILIPVLFTALITFMTMRISENRNKKRWQNDSFIKHKNELILKINKILSNFFDKLDNYFNLYESTDVEINAVSTFFNEYNDIITELRTSYRDLIEIYNIEVNILTKTLSNLYYIENYAKNNIATPDKSTIFLEDKAVDVSIHSYLSVLSIDFLKSRNAMIKIIQKKLK